MEGSSETEPAIMANDEVKSQISNKRFALLIVVSQLLTFNFQLLTCNPYICTKHPKGYKNKNMTLLSIFFGFMGGYEWVLILLAVLLLFGGKKIPELMRGLGSGIKEFKDAAKEENDKLDSKED